MRNATDFLNSIVDAWEALPGGGQVRNCDVERWLAEDMSPSINAIRGFLRRPKPDGTTVPSPAPAELLVGCELPADIIESLLAIGLVEWGVSLTQSDEKHASDLLDTLRITREHFGVTDQETGIHGVYLEGTGTVLAHTGMSPNSPQHARILVGAWNQLVDIAKARTALSTTSEEQL